MTFPAAFGAGGRATPVKERCMQTAEFTGKVTRGSFAKRSKSEHQAVYLETAKGRYVLRRQNGNPFADPNLDELVGKTIRCRGFLADYTLIMTDWEILDAKSP
jgi:hypothetical protein